jgi:hypothetical protein
MVVGERRVVAERPVHLENPFVFDQELVARHPAVIQASFDKIGSERSGPEAPRSNWWLMGRPSRSWPS